MGRLTLSRLLVSCFVAQLVLVTVAVSQGAAQHLMNSDNSSWDTRFDSLGMNSRVQAIVPVGSDILVGGRFTMGGGVVLNGIGRWDGTGWTALGSGVTGGTWPSVTNILVVGNDIYIGGSFTTAGATAALNVARWDGTQWHALGTGIPVASVSPPVGDIALFDGDIYFCGNFNTAGGVPVSSVARWDGSTWHDVGGGLAGSPVAIGGAFATDPSYLYIGGNISSAGGVPVTGLARWDGTSWSSVGTGVTGAVRSLAKSGTNLYVAGLFTNTTGAGTVVNIGCWNGSDWDTLAGGANDRVLSVRTEGSDVYIVGNFTTVGGIAVNRIAKWNGSGWSAFGSGLEFTGSPGWTFAVAPLSSDELYAGGDFDLAGGVPSNRIAYWRPPPGISVVPDSLADSLFTGANVGHPLTVVNTGSALLTWQITTDDSWVSAQPNAGVIAGGDSAIVNVTIDALGLFGGAYDSAVRVQSDSPNDPEVVIPVHLQVVDAPHIAVSPMVLDYGVVPVDSTTLDSLLLSNPGTLTLDVTSITSDNPAFSVLVSSAVIAPGMNTAIPVAFTPVSPGIFDGTLEITSNDPDQGQLFVGVSGEGALVPLIDVSPDSISVFQQTGVVRTSDLTLRNAGADVLVWHILVTEPWLLVFPDSGVTSAGDSIILSVETDALGLPGGLYESEPQVVSNAFNKPSLSIPVDMIVGSAPDILLSADTLTFSPTVIGESDSLVLEVSNIGHASLIVFSVGSDNASFTTDSTLFALIPATSKQLVVIFAPQETGAIDGVLTLNTNDPDEGIVEVALAGAGVVVSDVGDGPVGFRNHLAQNYPNPFNPTTTIAYSLGATGHTTLTIYDPTGRPVRRLVDEVQSPRPGGYHVIWDGRNDIGQAAATGVYFYRLTTRTFTQTRRLVLLK